jgi:preprotein translocase subunit SecG
MYHLVAVLIVIACILLILVVLVQSSKGGGLAAGFSGPSQIMGVRKTADFLEKATWTLASSILVLSLVASMTVPRQRDEVSKSKIEDQVENAIDPDRLSGFPTSAPEQQGSEEEDFGGQQ